MLIGGGITGAAMLLSFTVPETLHKDHRKAMSFDEASPIHRLQVAWKFPRFRIMLIPYLCNSFVESINGVILVYYMDRFHL